MVAEQLSLADFQQIGLSSLPANLHNCVKTVLRGKYCLQVKIVWLGGCFTIFLIQCKKCSSTGEYNSRCWPIMLFAI